MPMVTMTISQDIQNNGDELELSEYIPGTSNIFIPIYI